MKKILIITNHSYMFWQFRRELVRGILAGGHQVVLALPFGERVEQLRSLGCELVDIPVDRRGVNPVIDCKLLLRYRKLLAEVRPDMVITYSIKPNIYAGMACRNLGIPYYVNVQGLGTAFQKKRIARLVTVLYRIALRDARWVFFENSANADLFIRKGIIAEDQACLLRGAGINLEHYAFRPWPENSCTRFLYLGRVMREKGMDELFSALRRLHAEGEKIFLDLVGFFEDGYREQVEELEALGICKFHGFQEDPRPFYERTDCVVLPSYHEGMSNVLLEAAAVGRPLITSDIPGCREAVEEGVTGFTCPVRDAQALYETMKRFLLLSPEQRAAMGVAGRKKMQAEFDKNQVVEATLAALFQEEAHEAVR